MLLIYLNCILHTLLITNYLQTFSVGLRLHRAKQDFCILPHSEWHNLGRKRHLPGKQEKWNIYTNQTQILKEICYSVLYQGDSGGPLYKFNETAHKAVLGSFIDSEHLKKNTFDCGFIFCVKSFENEVSLVGVVNRGEGCARENAIGIYARVKVWRHFMTSVWMFNFFTFSASHEMDPAHCENRRMLKAV